VTLLSGMSTLAQVVENVQTMAAFEPLTPVERRALAMSLGGGAGSAIDCTYCRYCDPCPYGVDIAGTFHVYNTWAERLHLGEGEEATASDVERTEFIRHYHNEVAKKARADMCIHCDECLPKCPQHLPIPDLLAKINQLAGAADGKEASA
jgi:predicted aldo/keto reductase-like oxidoreductase